MTAAEEMQWMEQQTSNYSCWRRGDNGADDNNKKTTINKCAAAEAEDDNGWREVGHGGGARGVTVVQQLMKNSFTIRSWRMEVEDRQWCSLFL